MRIFVAAIAFGVTISGLFLFENYKTSPKKEDYAKIVQGLIDQDRISKPNYVKKSDKTLSKKTALSTSENKLPATPPSNSLIPSLTPAPTTALEPITSIPVSPAPTRVPISTPAPIATLTPESTPTATQTITAVPAESNQSTPAPSTAHIYYTSSYANAKYYYCDTDDSWKTLSAKYLKSFSSSEELLKSYSSRSLHELCK